MNAFSGNRKRRNRKAQEPESEGTGKLRKQKPDDYIDVDVDLAELEGTSAETKATYEKIKKYVAENNGGMKVSNLYIAQVKRKCVLELAENFNLPKSEDSRQPQCPKEKEKLLLGL